MKILMTSEFFYPHIGGIETVTEYLADEFSRMGHEVKIVTTTQETGDRVFSYEVLRKPSVKQLWRAYNWCDVFVHQGISLKRVWPLLIKKKPWFVIYHQVYFQSGIKGRIKKFLSYFAHNIAVSKTTYKGYGLSSGVVIYNSYSSKNFKSLNFTSKRTGIIFVGKLSKEKGVYVLLDAFEKMKKTKGINEKLILVGDGPQRKEIENYARTLTTSKDIEFLGFKSPHEICILLNKAKVQVVPSVAPEAFGVVVLEGLACGCQVIGSDGDGIKEALNDCGLVFKKGSSSSLCSQLLNIYSMDNEKLNILKINAKKWLAHLSLRNVAEQYINEFSKYYKK